MQTVVAYFDTQVGAQPGWYAKVLDRKGDIITDSQKIDFPLDLSRFRPEEGTRLLVALDHAFPECEVEIHY